MGVHCLHFYGSARRRYEGSNCLRKVEEYLLVDATSCPGRLESSLYVLTRVLREDEDSYVPSKCLQQGLLPQGLKPP